SDSTSLSVLVRSVRAGAAGCASTSRTDAAALEWAVRQARELGSLSATRLAPWNPTAWDPVARDPAAWDPDAGDTGDPAVHAPAGRDRGSDRWAELAALEAVPLDSAVQALRELERKALAA